MKIIGITGGVGAGKSKVLSFIEMHYRCRIIKADEAAHLLYQKGQACYEALTAFLGERILCGDGTIDKKKMAELIFQDKALLEGVNAIVHPAVKSYITEQIADERAKNEVDFFFIEAALLIEEHYEEIVDELWYIHSDENVRRQRLYQSRQYSEQKVSDIMKEQLDEHMFRKHCQRVIINNGDLEETYQQIQRIMGDGGLT